KTLNPHAYTILSLGWASPCYTGTRGHGSRKRERGCDHGFGGCLSVPQDTCDLCGKQGHWAKDCPDKRSHCSQ
uniref:CCHC-type domain-containing protein n=1 Tax=Monopterus albus TaxID=43700 RepID=A0A3Q3JI45_MONAL